MPIRRKSIYFLSLKLKNVRCFAEPQVLSLVDSSGRPARWTLLVGDNGVGKTTLLQCLAWMRPTPYYPPALLHEYPLRVGRRGPHFSGPSAGATLQG